MKGKKNELYSPGQIDIEKEEGKKKLFRLENGRPKD